MKYLLSISLLFISPALLAETIQGKVHAVQDGMIKFENGRIAFLDKINPELTRSEFIEAELDEKSSLMSFKRLPPAHQKYLKNFNPDTVPQFGPTLISGMEEAWNIFNRSNHNYKRVSECSDRAHVWAHDEFKHSGTKSMKAFVFFTNSYINSVRFKWWFHVAPMYKVKIGNSIQDMVMDYRYSDRPQTVQEWTDLFVYTKKPCKVTERLSDYDQSPQTEDCYLIFESMHYKFPSDISDQERLGKYKSQTDESEIAESLRNGFNSYEN